MAGTERGTGGLFPDAESADIGEMEDLAATFTAINQASVQTRVDYAVAKKMLDTQAAAGDAAVKLIQAAAKTQAETVRSTSAFGGIGARVDAQG